MVSICQCALELNDVDTALLVKLAPADMVALEAKYHTRCLAALYNRVRAATSSTNLVVVNMMTFIALLLQNW